MRFYLFPFCHRFSSNLSWYRYRIGLLVKMWYSLTSSYMNWINSLVFKPSQNVKIKLKKLKMLSLFCSEMYVSWWYLLQTIKRNPKLQKLDRDCKSKLFLSLLSQLDRFFYQSRCDQLIKAVSENKAHASGSNSVRLCEK